MQLNPKNVQSNLEKTYIHCNFYKRNELSAKKCLFNYVP